LAHATDEVVGSDDTNVRLAVHAIGENRHLPAEPGARIDAAILKRERQQAGGHLLARGDDDVVFAGVMERTGLARPLDELVGRAGHRRYHHRDLVAAIDLALHPRRHIADAIDIGHRGAAELLNDARHGVKDPPRPCATMMPPAPLAGKKAGIHTRRGAAEARRTRQGWREWTTRAPRPGQARSTATRSGALRVSHRRGGSPKASSDRCTSSIPCASPSFATGWARISRATRARCGHSPA